VATKDRVFLANSQPSESINDVVSVVDTYLEPGARVVLAHVSARVSRELDYLLTPAREERYHVAGTVRGSDEATFITIYVLDTPVFLPAGTVIARACTLPVLAIHLNVANLPLEDIAPSVQRDLPISTAFTVEPQPAPPRDENPARSRIIKMRDEARALKIPYALPDDMEGYVPDYSNYEPPTPARLQEQLKLFEKARKLLVGQLERLREALEAYGPVFDDKLRTAGPATVRLDTTEKEPFNKSFAPKDPQKLELLKGFVKEMLEQGVLTPVNSPYSSPSFVIPKPGQKGRWRFVTDFRALNGVTAKTRADPPPVEACLYALREKPMRSQIDLRSAFWQLGVYGPHVKKTATLIPGLGLFAYRRLPMGAKNSMASMQSHLSRIFAKELFRSVIVWADDIIVYSSSVEEHVEHLVGVFQILYKYGHTINLRKSTFFTTKVEYLGFEVDGDVVRPQRKFMEGLTNLQPPKNLRQVQALLGFFNYLRRFLPKYAEKTEPLQQLARRQQHGKPFQLSDSALQAFELVRQELLTLFQRRPLFLPDREKTLFLVSDASGVAIGGCIYQLTGSSKRHTAENIRPIAFLSRTLSDAERRYADVLISGRTGFQSALTEPLAALYMLESAADLIEYCASAELLTDHRNLEFLRHRDRGMLFRWALRMMQFAHVNIRHQSKGVVTIADCLSRLTGPAPAAAKNFARGGDDDATPSAPKEKAKKFDNNDDDDDDDDDADEYKLVCNREMRGLGMKCDTRNKEQEPSKSLPDTPAPKQESKTSTALEERRNDVSEFEPISKKQRVQKGPPFPVNARALQDDAVAEERRTCSPEDATRRPQDEQHENRDGQRRANVDDPGSTPAHVHADEIKLGISDCRDVYDESRNECGVLPANSAQLVTLEVKQRDGSQSSEVASPGYVRSRGRADVRGARDPAPRIVPEAPRASTTDAGDHDEERTCATEEETFTIMDTRLGDEIAETYLNDLDVANEAEAWVTIEDIAAEQRKHCEELKRAIRRGFKTTRSKFELINDVIYHLPGSFKDQAAAYYVPTKVLLVPNASVEMQGRIIRSIHRAHPYLGSHTGSKQTEMHVRERFYWRGISEQIREVIRACAICKLAKATSRKRQGFLQSYLRSVDNDAIAYDHIVLKKRQRSEDREVAICVITDYYSQYTVAYPLTSQEHPYLLAQFEAHYLCPYGVPRMVIADSELDSHVFSGFLTLLETKLSIITAYNSQSNPVERANRRIEECVRTMLFELGKRESFTRQELASFADFRWKYILPHVCAVINNHPIGSTRITPFEVKFGNKYRSAQDLLLSLPATPATMPTLSSYVKAKKELILGIGKIVKLALAEQRADSILQANRSRIFVKFFEGDMVYRYIPLRQSKIAPRAVGPYLVVEQLSPVLYKLKHVRDQSETVAHVNQLVRTTSYHGGASKGSLPLVEPAIPNLAEGRMDGKIILWKYKTTNVSYPDEEETFVSLVLHQCENRLVFQNYADRRPSKEDDYGLPVSQRQLAPQYRRVGKRDETRATWKPDFEDVPLMEWETLELMYILSIFDKFDLTSEGWSENAKRTLRKLHV